MLDWTSVCSRLWAVALILTLLMTKWDFFLGGKREVDFGGRLPYTYIIIKLSTIPHLPMGPKGILVLTVPQDTRSHR